jgi:anion-transporting  ArsA/GET3 family ATPase
MSKLFDAVGSSQGYGAVAPSESGVDRLLTFEKQMEKLEMMLRSPSASEFTVVTIPTDVALAETKVLNVFIHPSSLRSSHHYIHS